MVKLNWYVRDASQLAIYREVREKYFGAGPFPASTLVEVKGLVIDDLLIEVEAIAAPRRADLPRRAGPSLAHRGR